MKTIICQPDGQWSDSIDTFECDESPRCPPVHLPNGGKSIRFCSPGRLGKKCEMGCGKGFKVEGKSTLMCTMSGKWVGKTSTCLRSKLFSNHRNSQNDCLYKQSANLFLKSMEKFGVRAVPLVCKTDTAPLDVTQAFHWLDHEPHSVPPVVCGYQLFPAV